MVRRIWSIAAVAALVIMGFWGYREHQQKQALLLKAENQYQRAFHDLSSNISLLQDELGKSLAVNSQQQLTPSLSNVWRVSYAAQSDVGQLPLSMMPFNRTQEFLRDIGEFSYRVAVRDQQKKPLTADEWKTLKSLYNESNQVGQDLQTLQSEVLNKNLRWMDAELALSQTRKKTDNQIVDGFQAMEKKVGGFPEVQSDSLTAAKTRTKPHIDNVPGDSITKETAAQKTAAFLGKKDLTGINVQPNGKGAQYPSYSITVQEPNNNKFYMGMTIKGGYVTWLVNDREVKDETMDLVTAQEKGENWLNNHGYKNLGLLKVEQYGNTGVYTFAAKQGNVLLYPDTLTIKVGLDKGDVTGFNGTDYLFHHKQRNIGQPKLSLEQAKKFVSSRTKIQENNLSLIENETGKEVLTYEFIGTMDDDTYKIFINANSGEEERIEKVKQV